MRYYTKALFKVPIKSIRMLGGKLGKSLREAGLETMGDIQPLDVEHELIPLVGEKAQWVKNIAMGICEEEVNEKILPKSASAIKTFKEIHSFEMVQRQISLVCWDVISKIKEHIKDKGAYPTNLLVFQKKVAWSPSYEEREAGAWKKSTKMVQFEDFKEDPNCLIEHVKKTFKENEGDLPFPCRMIGVTV